MCFSSHRILSVLPKFDELLLSGPDSALKFHKSTSPAILPVTFVMFLKEFKNNSYLCFHFLFCFSFYSPPHFCHNSTKVRVEKRKCHELVISVLVTTEVIRQTLCLF